MVDVAPVERFSIVDAVHDEESRRDQLVDMSDLARIHGTFFPDYGFVPDELVDLMVHPSPQVIVHPWLLLWDEDPVGECIFHVNLERGIVLIHFIAVLPEARAGLPDGWLGRFIGAVERVATADAHARRQRLLGIVLEVPKDDDRHLRRWRRLGFQPIEVDYREPVHGTHWAEVPDEEFRPLTLMGGPVDAGRDMRWDGVAEAGVRAFLIDHYLLPESHPVVKAALAHLDVAGESL